jgi:phosphomannomutase
MISDLGVIAGQADFERGQGSSEQIDIRDEYVARLLKDYDGLRDLKVAWDNGNGASGEILRRLTAKLPGKHILLFDEIDGNFPNHHPDPTIEKNLEDLKKAVADNDCDIGIGFDGDGDRIGAIDHKGRVVWGDQLVAIYAKDVLKQHPGATIIADVKASQSLFDEVAKHGGKPLMWKTGHSLLKAKMAETGSPLAGEMSGHIFFADKWYGFDDALYCAVRLLGLVSRSGGTLAELRDALPDMVNTPETRFQVDEERKFAVVDEIKARLKAEGATVNDIDGVRVNTAEGWWLIRASNTQDVLVARAEAFDQNGLERLKNMIIDQLRASGIAAPAFDGGTSH